MGSAHARITQTKRIVRETDAMSTFAWRLRKPGGVCSELVIRSFLDAGGGVEGTAISNAGFESRSESLELVSCRCYRSQAEHAARARTRSRESPGAPRRC